MTTDLNPNPGRRLRPRAWHLFALMSSLFLALGAGWGAASAAQTSTPPAGTATPAITPAPNAPRLTIQVGQLNDSGVTGTATLYEAGKDQTIVAIDVKNVSGNHPSHIHAGTCEKFAPEPSYDLQNIDVNGKSTTLIKVSLANLLAKPYVIDAHLSPNELGTLIMCGEIKGTPATPTTTPGATATTAATTPAATTPAATKAPATTPPTATATATTAITTPPTATATAAATTPAATATATATAAIAPTGAGGEQIVTPTTTPAPTTPAVTPAAVTPVTSGKGIPAASGAVGGDGTGGSTASSTTLTVSSASTTSGSSGASASAPLPSVDSSGVNGAVTVFPASDGASAVIQVNLQGDLVGAGNLVHLHMGTCDNLDQNYTVDLNPVNDNGVSETVVDIPYQTLLTGGYAVNVHESADAYETWLVCGELSGSVATTTASGTGGQTASLLPQSTGAGTSIPRPETAAEAIAWSLGFFALLIGGCAQLIRRRESAARHRSLSRWLRLGL